MNARTLAPRGVQAGRSGRLRINFSYLDFGIQANGFQPGFSSWHFFALNDVGS
jgi:hypothetical protein